jgi:oxygen-independent coproporphyrinogen-3 oxidase
MAVSAGFDNINLDLMFSLPGQSVADWRETLECAAGLRPAHISAYSLIIEEGTPFYGLYGAGSPELPDEDTDREMYYLAEDVLSANGFHQYEISNFAQPFRESWHNIKYWRRQNYLGFGLSSHSCFDETRWHNTYSLPEYISADGLPGREEIQCLSDKDAMEETMYLGLRMNEGVSNEMFLTRFGQSLEAVYGDVIAEMTRDGLMKTEAESLKLTPRGRDLSNYVFYHFLL